MAVDEQVVLAVDASLKVDSVRHGLEVGRDSRDPGRDAVRAGFRGVVRLMGCSLSLGSLVAVAQVATVGKVETHETAVGRHDGLVDLQVGRAAAEALNVDTPLLGVDVEGLESTTLAQLLDLVDVLVATVVTGAGVTLGVLVGHGRTKSVEDGAGGDVLGGDEHDGLTLTLDLGFL